MSFGTIGYPKFQSFYNGAPNAGGLVYTYISNTTTPLATYTDNTGGTPNANPIVLDSNGEANIWLTQTSTYTFQINTASNTVIDTVNGITGIANINVGGLTLGGNLQILNYSITDSNGNNYLQFSTVASAVNDFEIFNASAGNQPRIQMVGADTNLSGELRAKGTGGWFLTDGNGNPVFVTVAGVASAVNYLAVQNAATGNNPVYGVAGTDTNITWVAGNKGAGQFLLQAQTNGTAAQLGLSCDPANGNKYIGFKAPANPTATLLWTLPGVDGSANQALITNGSGVLSWGAGGGGGSAAGSTGAIQWNNSGAFGGDTGLVTDGAGHLTLTLGSITLATSVINGAYNATVASASTTAIGAANANTCLITGTTTITAFDSVTAGAVRTCTFAGILTLTHNATSLILPNNGANITTAANDSATFVSLGSGNWQCVNYQRAKGAAVSNGLSIAMAMIFGH